MASDTPRVPSERRRVAASSPVLIVPLIVIASPILYDIVARFLG